MLLAVYLFCRRFLHHHHGTKQFDFGMCLKARAMLKHSHTLMMCWHWHTILMASNLPAAHLMVKSTCGTPLMQCLWAPLRAAATLQVEGAWVTAGLLLTQAQGNASPALATLLMAHFSLQEEAANLSACMMWWTRLLLCLFPFLHSSLSTSFSGVFHSLPFSLCLCFCVPLSSWG